jgi:hypothetical protein
MCAALETVQDCTTMRAFRGQMVRLIGTMVYFAARVFCEWRFRIPAHGNRFCPNAALKAS